MLDYAVSIAIIIGIQSLLTLSLNFQFGLTGLINFGQVAFYAVGAYAAAILSTAGWWQPFPILAGVGVSVLMSIALGLTTLRLREDYFAILTLGFAEVLRILLVNLSSISGGPIGISGIPRLVQVGPGTSYPLVFLGIVVTAVVLALAACTVLARSPLGRTLRAVRDDEHAAMALGKNPLRFRLLALVWGASLASVAGSLWAYYVSYVVPDQFIAEITFYSWMAMILGGLGSMAGSVLGTAILFVLIEGSRFLGDSGIRISASDLASIRQILIGAGLIAMIKLQSMRTTKH